MCLQWRATCLYGVGRSVERVTRFALSSSTDVVKEWGIAYRVAMVQVVSALTKLNQLHHADHVRARLCMLVASPPLRTCCVRHVCKCVCTRLTCVWCGSRVLEPARTCD